MASGILPAHHQIKNHNFEQTAFTNESIERGRHLKMPDLQVDSVAKYIKLDFYCQGNF